MKTITHELQQGSPQWLEFRRNHDGASEAAAMLGLSPYLKRSALLVQKATGISPEYSEWFQQNILNRGHAVEAAIRPHIEAEIGADLYPVTCSLEGKRLSASCDGLSLTSIAWECKQWNEALAAAVASGSVPDSHMPQCQQVLMVTQAGRLRFTVSDGTPERTVSVDVLPDLEWFERIARGWEQFEADVAAYVPEPAKVEAVGRAPETLPALRISVTGAVTDTNLAAFKETALSAIRSVNRELVTDQHFADADKSVKWCEEVESRLEAAKAHALSQTATIDELFRTMDEIAAESKTVRLALKKLIDARKSERKGEIVAGGIAALAKHVTALNESIGKAYMPAIPTDFAAAVKGLRSFDSMQDAVNTALAKAKIEANATQQRITENLRKLGEHSDHAHLFPDERSLVTKAPDDLAAVITSRIADYKDKEDKRQADEAAAKAASEAAVAAPSPAPAVTITAQQAAATDDMGAPLDAIAPPPAVVRISSAPERTVKLGDLVACFDSISFTADDLAKLGFHPVPAKGVAKMYLVSQFPAIKAAIIKSASAATLRVAEGVAA